MYVIVRVYFSVSFDEDAKEMYSKFKHDFITPNTIYCITVQFKFNLTILMGKRVEPQVL